MSAGIDALTLRDWLADGHEIALLDVREHGLYGEGHPFFAVNLPYSRLELDAPRLLPRLSVRSVLLDDGDGLAERAARRLAALGYTGLHRLAGGAPAWAAAGFTLFKGVNVPSKTFGELLEQRRHTPHLTAAQLQARLAAGEDLLLLDGRTPEEHRRMCIPGALPVPNGELVRQIGALLQGDTHKPIVVHCAGRTRSIVGAEILRELGLPNPVYALENGTQGWQLAGYALERGSTRVVDAVAPAPEPDEALLAPSQAQAWLDDRGRSSYVFDVRSAAEFAAGSLAGARHAPGGQLLQATDLYIAVRRARVLLVDDDGRRAAVIARWLRRLGHEAAAVQGGIAAGLRVPAAAPQPRIAALSEQGPADAALIDLRPSLAYRAGHAEGARWSIRPRVVADAQAHAAGRPLRLISEAPEIAALAALDLREAGFQSLAWRPASALLDAERATPGQPGDAEAIDHLFFVHDRHDGNLAAAQRYLDWELGLIEQCSSAELASFRL